MIIRLEAINNRLKKLNRQLFLLSGLIGLLIAVVGNFLKKSSSPLGLPLHVLGIIGLAIFWIYSLWDVFSSRFWTKETKLKWIAIVLLLPLVGPFIFYYKKKGVIQEEIYHNNIQSTEI